MRKNMPAQKNSLDFTQREIAPLITDGYRLLDSIMHIMHNPSIQNASAINPFHKVLFLIATSDDTQCI